MCLRSVDQLIQLHVRRAVKTEIAPSFGWRMADTSHFESALLRCHRISWFWCVSEWSANGRRDFLIGNSPKRQNPYKADITRRRCDNDDDDVDVCAVVVVIFCRLFFLLIIIYFFYFKLNQPLETRMRALVLAHSSSFALWRGANTRWHIFTR